MRAITLFIFCVCSFIPSISNASLAKVVYQFTNEPIDVVIPCAPKDKKTLSLAIEAIRKYGQNIRRVIVVSKEKFTDEAEWISESSYPFSKEDLAFEIFRGNKKQTKKFLNSKKTRIGWIYQQFLKLYAPFVIPGISSNVLILDSDVIFLSPVSFMNDQNEPIFHPATEYHAPYFEHMKRLHPHLCRVDANLSGVCHHMLFQRPVLTDLFNLIYEKHRIEAWKAICRCIDQKAAYQSSMSEYEIYFNFARLRSDQTHLVSLKYMDVYPLREVEKYQNLGYAFITSHDYSR